MRCRSSPGDVGNYGGIMTDAYARVLKADGTVLKGLYTTGTTSASAMGRTYPGAGCSIGPSFTWGYVAARHAARIGNQTLVQEQGSNQRSKDWICTQGSTRPEIT